MYRHIRYYCRLENRNRNNEVEMEGKEEIRIEEINLMDKNNVPYFYTATEGGKNDEKNRRLINETFTLFLSSHYFRSLLRLDLNRVGWLSSWSRLPPLYKKGKINFVPSCGMESPLF
ncbi:hypothetical protein TNIN_319061 [Trichonephila inaurata madagascariensis]|uniref:Uncharacterized protein n=1 Tax=Trichonephila inaurata madagascariensis TaxID=2747483 RepID=A0A8X6IUP8_9ARAC|nr:hypothetical protein TNIN_319061 [Trichonephila inaurata madagascariensis]